MTMTRKNNTKDNQMILSTLEDLVPQNHEVRKLEEAIDWNFIYPLVEDLYSHCGRKSIDPVVLFKIIIINYTFGYNSIRKTCREIEVNVAYRWFLGIAMDDKVPNYSTWSQNYIRRYGDSEVFEQIFSYILEQAMENGFIDTTTVYGDSTHMKASANKRKSIRERVEITKKEYEDDLLREINQVRASHNQKPIDSLTRKEYDYDEETGEVIEVTKTKEIKQSITDPESGNYHKGEHEECFAYSHQTFCDKNGFVLAHETVPGNMHDSVSFFSAYHKLINKIDGIKNICLDAGYKTGAIIREIIKNGQTPYLPYRRPMTKKEFISKRDYVYDDEFDSYICPNEKLLEYTTTNRQGYKEYKSNPQECINCPFISKCTKSKNHQKVVTRSVWEEYIDIAEEVRHSQEWKDIYPKRKETIERVFADGKENHCLRFTRVRGLKKNHHVGAMIFACHNLQKLGKWKWKKEKNIPLSSKLLTLFLNFLLRLLFS